MVIETKVLTVFGLKITTTGIPKKVVHYMATLPQCSSVLQLHIPRTLWKRPINVSFELRKNHNMIGMMMVIFNGLSIFFNKYPVLLLHENTNVLTSTVNIRYLEPSWDR